MRRILVVDDHPILREGLARLIEREPDLHVIGEAGDVSTGLALARERRPHAAVVDVSLGAENGLDLVRSLWNEVPSVPSLVLSMHDEALFAERALRSGARGYLSKDAAAVDVVGAIRKVLRGEMSVPERTSARLIKALAPRRTTDAPLDGGDAALQALTDRELE